MKISSTVITLGLAAAAFAAGVGVPLIVERSRSVPAEVAAVPVADPAPEVDPTPSANHAAVVALTTEVGRLGEELRAARAARIEALAAGGNEGGDGAREMALQLVRDAEADVPRMGAPAHASAFVYDEDSTPVTAPDEAEDLPDVLDTSRDEASTRYAATDDEDYGDDADVVYVDEGDTVYYEEVSYGDTYVYQTYVPGHTHYVGCGHHYYGCACHPWYYTLGNRLSYHVGWFPSYVSHSYYRSPYACGPASYSYTHGWYRYADCYDTFRPIRSVSWGYRGSSDHYAFGLGWYGCSSYLSLSYGHYDRDDGCRDGYASAPSRRHAFRRGFRQGYRDGYADGTVSTRPVASHRSVPRRSVPRRTERAAPASVSVTASASLSDTRRRGPSGAGAARLESRRDARASNRDVARMGSALSDRTRTPRVGTARTGSRNSSGRVQTGATASKTPSVTRPADSGRASFGAGRRDTTRTSTPTVDSGRIGASGARSLADRLRNRTTGGGHATERRVVRTRSDATSRGAPASTDDSTRRREAARRDARTQGSRAEPRRDQPRVTRRERPAPPPVTRTRTEPRRDTPRVERRQNPAPRVERRQAPAPRVERRQNQPQQRARPAPQRTERRAPNRNRGRRNRDDN